MFFCRGAGLKRDGGKSGQRLRVAGVFIGAGVFRGGSETETFVRGELDKFLVGSRFFLTGIDVVETGAFFVFDGEATEFVEVHFFVPCQCLYDDFEGRVYDG